jgi:hypothetical protein
MVLDDLTKYKSAPLSFDVNVKLIPVTIFDISDSGAEEFNEIYRFHLDNFDNTITRTPSRGISTDRRVFRPPMWDIRNTRSCFEITSIMTNGMRRFQFRSPLKPEESNEKIELVSGYKAVTIFARKLKQLTGIDLCRYRVWDGLEQRAKAPKYMIKVNRSMCFESPCIEDCRTYQGVHHIDFHSSFGAGLANSYPEFRETVEYFYARRNERPEYKSVINSAVGAFWSPSYLNAAYAPLAIAAISDNNRRLTEVSEALEESGRVPLLWNTDGVWYLGDIYHGPGEGKGLGQWENDHINCTFRAKSRGAYEYIENGIYHPVVRGVPNANKASWKWGDIFKKAEKEKAPEYIFIPGKGAIRRETIEI